MAILNFREEFQGRYQDILRKALVSFKVANSRFESDLKFGDTVHRFKLDLSNVIIRDVVRYVDQTIDTISDVDQIMTIDQQKGAAFAVADWDALQAGPLNPGMVAGREIAYKVKKYIDASVFNEVRNAQYAFDEGDLTTLSSTGTPITLSTTNVAAFVTRTFAKLQALDIPEGDWIWVLDPYAAAIIGQHAIGKDINLAGETLKNGWSGNLFGSPVYITNNLTGEARLLMATNPGAGETVTVQGVIFTFVAAVGATAGNVLIGANAAATRANLIAAINGAAGAGTTYVALSTANRNTLTNARITAVDYNATVANTIQVLGVGAGRLVVAETLAGAGDTWTQNFVHAYFGRRNSIDLVVQDNPEPDIRKEPKQKTSNVLIDALFGLKTFDDSKMYFLDVKIAA